MVMIEKLENLKAIPINTEILKGILEDSFNIEVRSECEIFVKPEKKENKESLKLKLMETIKNAIDFSNESMSLYLKFIKTTNKIIIRIKRMERNSR